MHFEADGNRYGSFFKPFTEVDRSNKYFDCACFASTLEEFC